MTSNPQPNSVFDVTVQDVGTKYFAPDVVPGVVSDAYNQQLNHFLSVYNNYVDGFYTLSPGNASTVFQELLDAKNALISLASNGVPLTGGGIGYLNQMMANSLNTLFQTLDIAGVTQANAGTSSTAQAAQLTAVQNWLDLSTAGLGAILAQAGQAGQSGRSIQAMIELEYIKAGNDLIMNKLGDLQSALGLTQKSTGFLTTLQNILNKVTPSAARSISQQLNATSPDNYVSSYQTAGNTAYNTPIGVIPGADSTDVHNFAQLSSSIGPLHSLMSTLLTLANPPWTQGLDGPNGAFSSTTGQLSANAQYLSGTLVASLYQVYHDMRYPIFATFGTTPDQLTPATNPTARCATWIADNMGNAALQGNYSNDLTTAQTSAESLNSSQSQQIQQTLFIFQEFYQSGSGMLTQINQIIQAMAQAAGQ